MGLHTPQGHTPQGVDTCLSPLQPEWSQALHIVIYKRVGPEAGATRAVPQRAAAGHPRPPWVPLVGGRPHWVRESWGTEFI